MSNSVDPDETAHYEPSQLDLRCLQKPIIICGSGRGNSPRTHCGYLLEVEVLFMSYHILAWRNKAMGEDLLAKAEFFS